MVAFRDQGSRESTPGRALSLARIGLISDTHGLLRPQALAFLRGSDFIVHAGDIGDARLLEELRALAPVTAVRGNNDKGPWARRVSETEVLRIGNEEFYEVLHEQVEIAEGVIRMLSNRLRGATAELGRMKRASG